VSVSKSVLHRWRLLPTRIESRQRGVLSNIHQRCCFVSMISKHKVIYFFSCRIVKNIRRSIFNWLGWNLTDWWHEEVENFSSFDFIGKGIGTSFASLLFINKILIIEKKNSYIKFMSLTIILTHKDYFISQAKSLQRI